MSNENQNNPDRFNPVCVRCWHARPQVHHLWCDRCYQEMHRLAAAYPMVNTCQNPRCGRRTEPGKPLCEACEREYGKVNDGGQ